MTLNRYVDFQYGWRLWEVRRHSHALLVSVLLALLTQKQSEFNFARLGALVIDLFWIYYFHRYMRTEGGKLPIQRCDSVLWCVLCECVVERSSCSLRVCLCVFDVLM